MTSARRDTHAEVMRKSPFFVLGPLFGVTGLALMWHQAIFLNTPLPVCLQGHLVQVFTQGSLKGNKLGCLRSSKKV